MSALDWPPKWPAYVPYAPNTSYGTHGVNRFGAEGEYAHADAGEFDPQAAGRGWDLIEQADTTVIVIGKTSKKAQRYTTLGKGTDPAQAVARALAAWPAWL